ncbi:MAG: beta-ketoacyl-[acyl-carrier-protein] synthase family protein [Humibacter sp.]
MSQQFRRVAVTGLGAITPVGSDAPSTWSSLVAGRSGVALIEEAWAQELPVRIAGLVAPGYADELEVKLRRRTDPAEQLAIVAGREAWADAGITDHDPDRFAVVVGSAIGGLHTTLEQQALLDDRGPRRVNPHTVTMMMANGPAAWLSMDLGARAGARAPVSACASGSEAVLMGWEMIRSGSADVVLVGGTESCVTGLTLASLAQTRALSRDNDDPQRASRPFDVTRNGFVLGEGAAMLVLEAEEHAIARGRHPDVFVEGAALTSDAFDIVAADPKNQERTMRLALTSSGVAASDVGFVQAHATSTELGDVNEARALAAALGDGTAVTATKSMTGHLLGAAGALGTLAAVRSLQTGVVPPTAGTTEVGPDIEVDVVTGEARRVDARAGLVNAFGFGGHNVTLVLVRD